MTFLPETLQITLSPSWVLYWLSLLQSAQFAVHWCIFEWLFLSAAIYYLKMSSLFCCSWKINDSLWAPNMYIESFLTNFLKLCISVLSAADIGWLCNFLLAHYLHMHISLFNFLVGIYVYIYGLYLAVQTYICRDIDDTDTYKFGRYIQCTHAHTVWCWHP